MHRPDIAATTLFCLALVAAAPAAAQDYPDRPIRIILPYGTGGNTDTVSRILAPFMSTDLGQQVVVENRGGGAGIPGMVAVAKSRPDGYTALFAASNLAANPILFKTLPYDAEKDFAPVTLVAIVPTVLVVHPSMPVRTVKQLVALAKARPGALNYGSVGNGSGNHLTTEVFANATGIKVEHIPYRGSGPLMTDLIGGRITFIFSTIPAAHVQIAEKRIRAIAVSSIKRSGALPEVPTVAESGVPGFDVNTWLGIFLPAGTPARAIDRLNASTVKALNQPKVREVLATAGAEPVGSTPAQMGAHLKSEIARWKKLAETVSFTVAD